MRTTAHLGRLGKFPLRVIAIDPGVTGALAVVRYEDGCLFTETVHDLPTWSEKTASGKNRRYVDPVALHKLLKQIGDVDSVVVERLTAPPGIASTVAFSLGATAATIGSVLRLLGKQPKLVSPVTWKRAIEAPAEKEAARKHACRLFENDEHWPKKKDHNRAEAALIGAWYCLSH
jgi:hypothetical protein